MSMCVGTVSKALEMSMVAIRVLSAGFLVLKPSSMSWVRQVSVVVVECSGLEPCCDLSSGMCSLSFSITRRSNSLEVVFSNEIGLYDPGSFGSLPGFKIGMILAVFHEEGMWLWRIVSLKKFVRYCIAWGPRCLRWKFDMLSVPVELVFFNFEMACVVSCVVNGSGRVWSRGVFLTRL